jgi:acyl-CoA thioester hydrolase
MPDTDMMGVVYHANYSVFFEIGRSEYMRQKGFTYREFEEMGYHLVVTGMEAKYYNSATYDDLITVRTRISELQSRGLTFHYAIYRDKTLLVEGITKHLCITNNKKPVVIPPHLLNILRKC